ncbi:MAG: hypothetical protein ACOYOK_03900 [Pseudobdellovibrionaceae bacterium]|jgi:hypothetical protein
MLVAIWFTFVISVVLFGFGFLALIYWNYRKTRPGAGSRALKAEALKSKDSNLSTSGVPLV